ncbi:M15 family metallopeptidase [Pleomorphovibrio marinus]|uniref:M15 family metallopeptidase n=1 Tax=Pleomorphovibrio marinus TaxID=2164132 RepID=UPI000E0AA7D3|nr:M15 family metallopeptidase [Pleomorphovibrio marinus]
MKKALWVLCVGLLLLKCQQKSHDSEEETDLPRLEEGYFLDEDDRENLDFSTTTDTIGELEKSLINAGLVNIKEVIPGIFVELKYSSTDNFFGQDVYEDLENAYLQPQVAEKLKVSYDWLKKNHPDLTFLIYDGVRPRRVQQILWDNLDKPDSLKPLYVADPKRGSLHNYGVAVDLTLADAETGEPLDLGTSYDYFGYPAYPDREDQMLREGKITKAHVEGRKILREAMRRGGFSGIGSEWWHFDAFSRREASEKFNIVE